MNFNYSFETKEEKEDFLKTRIESVDFSDKTKESFLSNNIRTLGGLINKDEGDLRKIFNLSESDLNLIIEKLDILVLEIKIKFKKRNAKIEKTNQETKEDSESDQFVG